jgi:adenylyltransferase/sulfurtransferase
MFSISSTPLKRDDLHEALSNKSAGAIVVFEGWVRNHNEGKQVSALEYQVYRELALKEGEKILKEAREKFNLHHVISVHREGHLELGDVAIWIGATASHRDDAFKATRYVIDEIKHRLPVWKKEHYTHDKAEWVFCRHHSHHVHFEEKDFYQKQSTLIDQNKLKQAKVLVVGAGGLGCPALVSLASAGIGELKIVDPDNISITNIHRQFLYSPNLVGEKKALVAKTRLSELNPFIKVEAIVDFFTPEHLEGVNLVLDCTDNMKTKYFIHDACFQKKIPLVSAGIFKFEGQLRTFIPEQGCLRCQVTSTPVDSLLGNCNDFGVLGAATNALGSIQALEAIEFLNTGVNTSFRATIHLNLKNLTQLKVKNKATPDCPTCKGIVTFDENDLEVSSVEEAELFDIRELSDKDLLSLEKSDKKIVLCCHRGVRSMKMAQELRSLGHQHVYSLKGGAQTLV